MNLPDAADRADARRASRQTRLAMATSAVCSPSCYAVDQAELEKEKATSAYLLTPSELYFLYANVISIAGELSMRIFLLMTVALFGARAADAAVIYLTFTAEGIATSGTIGHFVKTPFSFFGSFSFDNVTTTLKSIDFNQDGTIYTTNTASIVYHDDQYFLGGNVSGPDGLSVQGSKSTAQNDFALTFKADFTPISFNAQTFGKARDQYTETVTIRQVAAPTPTPSPAAVPETATWMMMIGGMGLIGAALRRQRSRRQGDARGHYAIA